MNWWVFVVAYLLSGILYAAIGVIVTMVHYSRIFGLEKTVIAMKIVNERNKDDMSWKNAPVNIALWPWRIVQNGIYYWQELGEVLYSGEVKEGT